MKDSHFLILLSVAAFVFGLQYEGNLDITAACCIAGVFFMFLGLEKMK